MVIFFKNSNCYLSGWASQSNGLFLSDTYDKKKVIALYRKHYGLKGKHISFYFNDGERLTLYK